MLAWVRSAGFVWRVRPRHVRAALYARRLARTPEGEGSPLSPAGERIFEIDPRWLRAHLGDYAVADEPGLRAVDPLVVVHFVGTGETKHGPLPSIGRVIGVCPELGRLRHFVVDSPPEPDAYDDIAELSRRTWRSLEPLIDRESGPFLFVGLSRGAVLALELGARVADEKQKVASCVAFSPPFARPCPMPPVIRLVAGLDRLLEAYADLRLMGAMPRWFERAADAAVRPLQVAISAYILADFGAADEATLRCTLRDLREVSAIDMARRQVGEFALLDRCCDPEIVRFVRTVARSFVRSELASATVAWGARDTWVDPRACRSCFEGALARVAESQSAVAFGMVPNGLHNLSRGAAEDLGALRPYFERALREARDRAERAERRVEDRLRWEHRMRQQTHCYLEQQRHMGSEPISEERYV